MRPFLAASAALAAIAVVPGGCVVVATTSPCGGGGGASILISPSVVFVAIGESATPRASWCHDGRYDNLSPRWSLRSSADATIISLDANTGRITGKRVGQATVVATYEGVEGSSMQVTVR